ncbi:MAG: hypothetical protein KGD73_04225 [Candidatus Lokiarchaeota archaeon]|nr:hypothetical protein [Candidatus Lokiarchaeota archaeon]
MKKLANRLSKIDIDLPKWTRDILFEHISEFCKDFKNKAEYKREKAVI